jgi:NAD(P)-dependent dehydrogenase (short-subunit alcohol dehydrogenase family)
MTEIVMEQLPVDALWPNAVVLVIGADTDEGYRLARELLRAGCRVAATAHCPTDLVRILHGYGPERVLAVAADMDDEAQRQRVIARVERQFGHIDATMPGEWNRD